MPRLDGTLAVARDRAFARHRPATRTASPTSPPAASATPGSASASCTPRTASPAWSSPGGPAAARLAEVMGAGALPLDRRFRTIGYRARRRGGRGPRSTRRRGTCLAGLRRPALNAALDSGPPSRSSCRLLGVSPERWTAGRQHPHDQDDGDAPLRERGHRGRCGPASSRPTASGGSASSGAASTGRGPDPTPGRWRGGTPRAASPSSRATRTCASRPPRSGTSPTSRPPACGCGAARLPGIAAVPVGRNAEVAWGMTSVYADVQDLYVETVDPADPGSYLTPAGPAPFDVRAETIAVRGGDPVRLTVRSTRHGPVVSDLPAFAFAGPGQVVAFRSDELGGTDRSQRAAFRAVRAATAADFGAAMRELEAVVQTAVHADAAGDIGYVVTGRVPVRAAGDGFLPVAGTDPGSAWTGRLQGAALPARRTPRTGGSRAPTSTWRRPAIRTSSCGTAPRATGRSGCARSSPPCPRAASRRSGSRPCRRTSSRPPPAPSCRCCWPPAPSPGPALTRPGCSAGGTSAWRRTAPNRSCTRPGTGRWSGAWSRRCSAAPRCR